MMNIWQGSFPEHNTKDDGYEYTCPVKEKKNKSIKN
jgi:hypothetical protein